MFPRLTNLKALQQIEQLLRKLEQIQSGLLVGLMTLLGAAKELAHSTDDNVHGDIRVLQREWRGLSFRLDEASAGRLGDHLLDDGTRRLEGKVHCRRGNRLG